MSNSATPGNGSYNSSQESAPNYANSQALDQLVEQTEEFLENTQKKIEDTVRKNPIQAVIVCVGIGCVLGTLWGLSRRK